MALFTILRCIFAAMLTQNRESCWYKDWFDSPYYHLLYSNHDEKEAMEFIRLLSVSLGLPPGARLLDLACGKGRHSLALHRLGYDVTGVDLSPASIREARTQETDGLAFFEHDMRRPFMINYFDGVFNFFTSFGYFESRNDNRLVVDAVCKALHRGGYFVIDFLNAAWVEKMIAANPSGEKTAGNVHFEWNKTIENGFIRKAIRISDGEKQFEYSESVQLLRPADFENLLGRYFTIEKSFGDYSLGAFREDQSPRLILIARKR